MKGGTFLYKTVDGTNSIYHYLGEGGVELSLKYDKDGNRVEEALTDYGLVQENTPGFVSLDVYLSENFGGPNNIDRLGLEDSKLNKAWETVFKASV